MFWSRNDNWARVRELFENQFEADGEGFVYRRSQKGEAIRVSADEREGFIEAFNRQLHYAMWGICAGITIVLGITVWLSVRSHADPSNVSIYVGVGIVMIFYLAYYRWAWAAPARQLAGRMPMAGELSPDEIQRLKFGRMKYSRLAGAAAGGLFLPILMIRRYDLFSGWGRLWLVFSGALVLLAGVQAFRKWRFELENN